MTIVLCVLLLLLAVLAVAGFCMARFACLRNPKAPDYWTLPDEPPPVFGNIARKDQDTIDSGRRFLLRHAKAPVYITSRDGLRLQGHYVPSGMGTTPKAIVMQVHGYRSHPLSDFAGTAEAFCGQGFDLFLIDQRCSGGSQGKYITFGLLERYDVADWCRFLSETYPGIPVLLDGVSMGAATVILAAGENLPDNVCGIIADCGYSSPAAICKKVLKQWFRLPPFPIYYITVLWLRLMTGVWFSHVPADPYATGECAAALSKNTLPLLMAHGTGDTFVPSSMSEDNFTHCDPQNCELLLVDGAEHGLSWFEGMDMYQKALSRLLDRCGIS